MKILALSRYALGICASVALLAACSTGVGSLGSIGGSHGVVPSASSSTDMIYVSAGSRIKVYTYPGQAEVGQLRLFTIRSAYARIRPEMCSRPSDKPKPYLNMRMGAQKNCEARRYGLGAPRLFL